MEKIASLDSTVGTVMHMGKVNGFVDRIVLFRTAVNETGFYLQ
jgi:hypothetical protein